MKKLTREERRRRSKRTLALLTYLCFLMLLLIWLIGFLVMDVTAAPLSKAVQVRDGGRLTGDDVPATERCYMTAEEIKTENELIEEALLARSHKIEDVTITFYCCEEYAHICGTGNGITASGRRVTPYVSCAVDPDVIPLGSTVMLEYNGEMVYLRADDTGGAVNGNHIDIAVPTHDFALSLGIQTADIWWCED